ncbi:hypothetical protein QR685DRAFT_287107 [Neurospora intermedia]|uniref:NDT80 domain-containing protein n=1 Tax=Neurospora intermedia TaxID=5142 RepID=A0ABR3D9T0_NEUIN
MASFNSIPQLPNGAPVDTADALGLSAPGQPMGMGMGIGMGDPFGFEEALLDVNADLHAGIPFTPSAYDFDNFTFEDPFSTTTSFPPLPAHSQGHSHIHIQGHGHTPYNLPSVGGGPIVGAVAAEAEAALKITTNEVDSPSDLLDNKLLGFSPPIPSGQATLVDSETGRFADLNMTAELYGMFFVAEDVFASNTPVSDQGQGLGQGQGQGLAQHPGARPLELTCYRRNLWQCTGQITLPRHALHCSLLLDGNEQQGGGNGAGRQVRIKELWASITAMESIEGKPTEIISIPWKSNNPAFAAAGGGQQQGQGQQPEESSRTATTPPKQLLDLSAGQEIDKSGNRVSIPVSWKRLQFKHATANNGRRKGLQQHYVVQINLLAKTVESGDKLIKLAEIQSGPVIVRGRSPRNFDSRRDVPLTGDRKGMLQRTNMEGSGGVGAGAGGNGSHEKQQTQQQQGMDRTEMFQRYHSLGNQVCFHCPPPSDWSSSTGGPTPQPFSTSPNLQHPNKKLAMSSNSPGSSRPPIPSWESSSSDAANNHNSSSRRNPTPLAAPNRTSHHRNASSSTGALPISLSLSEDEQRSPPMNRTATPGSAGAGDSPLYGKMGVATGGLKRDTTTGKGMGLVGHGSGGLTSYSSNKSESHFESGSLGQQNQYQKENVGSPIEAADLLYEYFPLSLDDWMPPVDAVYRPHVVHHTIVPPEIKAQQTNSKTKRYFAAE